MCLGKNGHWKQQAGISYIKKGADNGGLIFSGRKNDKGQIVDSGVSLSFDRYGAGQTVQLAGVDDSENHFAGLGINDVSGQRLWVGRNGHGLASVSLAGADGKDRIRLQVTGKGKGSHCFDPPTVELDQAQLLPLISSLWCSLQRQQLKIGYLRGDMQRRAPLRSQACMSERSASSRRMP